MVVIRLALACLLLSGCASTITVTAKDGSITNAKAGFGNKVSLGTCSIEPSPSVVAAGQYLLEKGMTVAQPIIKEEADKLIDKMGSEAK